MKKIMIMLLIFTMFTGCGKKVTFEDLEIRNGKTYLVGKKNPYTGEVFNNFNKKLTGKYEDGKENGEFKYYRDSKLFKTKNYKNGQLDGEVANYNLLGSKIIIENYKMDKKDGLWISYDSKGRQIINTYKNDKKDGLWDYNKVQLLHNNKVVSNRITEYYINNILHGLQTIYDSDENVFRKQTYKNGKLQGEATYYYKNGQIKEKVNYENGIKDGSYISYYENGEIEEEAYYKKNIKYKSIISYYGNGQIKEKVILGYKISSFDRYYSTGIKDGGYISYYENGQIKEKAFYNEGEFDGDYISYYENGQIKEKAFYNNGTFDGKYIFHYENGQIKEEVSYNKGIFDGKYIVFREDGNIIEKGEYSNGKKLKKTQFDYYTSYKPFTLFQKTIYETFDGQLLASGSYKRYYRSGKKFINGTYSRGQKIGDWITYFEDGREYQRVSYPQKIN